MPKRTERQFTEVKLTAKGEELLRSGEEVIWALGVNLLSCLSGEELEQFQKLLRKVEQKALEELSAELTPALPALSEGLGDIEQ